MKNSSGFSLIELMTVLAIIAILAMVAFPSYNSSVRKSNRTDARESLLNLQSQMERYFYANKTYTTDMKLIGYALSSANPSPEEKYTLSIEAATADCVITSCYSLKATAVGSQVEDGDLTLDSKGQKLPEDKW